MSEQLALSEKLKLLQVLREFNAQNKPPKKTKPETIKPVTINFLKIGLVGLGALIASNLPGVDSNHQRFLQPECASHSDQPAVTFNVTLLVERIKNGQMSMIYQSRDRQIEAVFPTDDQNWADDGLIPAYQDSDQWIPLDGSTDGDTVMIARGKITHEQLQSGNFMRIEQLKVDQRICNS